jgi:phosphoglycerate-specific signal transduction histidine kinase
LRKLNIDDSSPRQSELRSMRTPSEKLPAPKSGSRAERAELVGGVATDLAHSLNNSFNAMLLRLNLLRDEVNVAPAVSHVDALSRLITDTARKIAALQEFVGQGEYPLERFALANLLDAALVRLSLAHRGSSTELALRVELPPVLPEVLGHVAESGQMLDVLLRYIVQHRASEAPSLVIKAGVSADSVLLMIGSRDFALTLREGERRFDPFDALRRGPDRVRLLAAQSLMRHCGGAFTMSETDSGVGFVLEFPLALPAAQ